MLKDKDIENMMLYNRKNEILKIKNNSFKYKINNNNNNYNEKDNIDKKKYEDIELPIKIFWFTIWILILIFLVFASLILISEIHNKYLWVFIIFILVSIIRLIIINKKNKIKETLIDQATYERYKKLYFKKKDNKYNHIKFKASNFTYKIKYIYPILNKRWIYVYHYIDNKEFFKATLNYPILLKFLISFIWVIISLIITILSILIYILLSLPFIILIWFLLWYSFYEWLTDNHSNIFVKIMGTIILLLLPITYYIFKVLLIPYIKSIFNIMKTSTSLKWSKNQFKSQLANFTWSFEILKLYINWNNLVFLDNWIIFPKKFYPYNSNKLSEIIWKYEYYFQEKLFEDNKLSDKKTNILHNINFLFNYIIILLTKLFQKLFPNFNQKLYNLTYKLWENNNKINSLYKQLKNDFNSFISWDIFNLEKEVSKKLPNLLQNIRNNLKIIQKIKDLIETNKLFQSHLDIEKYSNYQRQQFNDIIDKVIQLLQKYSNLTNKGIIQLNKIENNWQIKLKKISMQNLYKNLQKNIILLENMKI